MPIRCLATALDAPTTPELPPLVVIAGATATGKSELALRLALEIDGAEIVSADSRQVYRGMDIATAKPSPAEQAVVPHHCLDLVDPDEPFTAADYQRAATEALTGIAERDGVAILVGGTGLYLRAIGRGLPLDLGDTDPSLRASFDARFERHGLQPLTAELVGLDPTAGESIDLRNPRRVIRALERAHVTGFAAPPPPLGYPGLQTWLGLSLDPPAHRHRIATRIQAHFESGLLEEAERLRDRHAEDLPAFSAMGYREAFDVLAGRSSIEEAQASDAARTWSYARRQRTWFRSEPGVEWLAAGEGAVDAGRKALAPFLRALGRDVYAGR